MMVDDEHYIDDGGVRASEPQGEGDGDIVDIDDDDDNSVDGGGGSCFDLQAFLSNYEFLTLIWGFKFGI